MGDSKFHLYKLAVAIANNIATCLAPTCVASVNETQSADRREEQKRSRGRGSAREGRVGILTGYSAQEGEESGALNRGTGMCVLLTFLNMKH